MKFEFEVVKFRREVQASNTPVGSRTDDLIDLA